MRKYKQVKKKKVVYSLDEWAVIEQRAANLAMKTGTYIKRISLDGQIKHYRTGDIATVMNALRIIGSNINRITRTFARKAFGDIGQGRANDCQGTPLENAQDCVGEQQHCKPLGLRVPQVRCCRHAEKNAPLKENFEKCSKLCELYSEIAKTYYEISKGDYIARLVEEERKTADAEKRKTDRNNRI